MSSKNNKQAQLPFSRVLANNLFIVAIAFKAAPAAVFYLTFHGIFWQVKIFFEHTYQIVFIVNAIQYGRPFADVLRFLLIMTGIILIDLGYHSFSEIRTAPRGREKIYRAVREKLYEKAKDIDIACYDNPEYYNDYVFALNNVTQRVDSVMLNIRNTLMNIAMLITYGGYIVLADSTSFIFIVVSFIATYIFRSKFVKAGFELNQSLNPILRKRDYVNRIFYLPDYVKEIRLSGVKERLFEDYSEAETQVYEVLKKRTRKIAALEFLQGYLSSAFLFDFLFLIYLMYLTVVQGAIGFGTLFGLYRSSQSAKNTIGSLTETIAGLREQSLYIDKMRDFLNYEQKIISKPDAKPVKTSGGIELRGVSFTYPGASEKTLSDVTLKINQGEKVAIVGYNGAGKTTLIKLLMRLYDPSSGEILYANEDVRNYDVGEYRNIFSTLFQDFQIYAATAAQNILAGNDEPNAEKLTLALEKGGIAERIAKMPGGVDTQLTKEFIEGEELSGGERQKLATSRSLYKDSPVIIFDEPSSALDPIAEFELNSTMLELERDKTVIFISHRLSITRIADKIFMFEQGKLIESGSHDELMAVNGKYAEMFRVQAEKYR